jgi:hypothetical protein
MRFWWERPGATLARFFASLAMVDTWGDQPPSGVVGGGPARGPRGGAPGGAALPPPPGRAGGAFFFFWGGGRFGDKRLDRAGVARRSWGPAKIKKTAPLRLKTQAHRSLCPFEGVEGDFVSRSCSLPDITGRVLAIYVVSVSSSDPRSKGHF